MFKHMLDLYNHIQFAHRKFVLSLYIYILYFVFVQLNTQNSIVYDTIYIYGIYSIYIYIYMCIYHIYIYAYTQCVYNIYICSIY